MISPFALISALAKIISNGYKALHLHYFFTCGSDEVKAWTIMVGGADVCLFDSDVLPSGFSKGQKRLRQVGRFILILRGVLSWQRLVVWVLI